ncbi:MAG: SDR family oxidoreductase [Acidimicrobiales bacterium]
MSQFSFEGKVAVVTGGASGIGLAMASKFTALGARVALVDIDGAAAENAAAAADLRGAIGLAADVGDEPAARAAIEQVESELGPIDVYCSNAGVAAGRGLGTDAEWDLSWSVHGLAHVIAARTLLPAWEARGSGVFVVTASAAGLLMMMQTAPYTVTKHASVAIAEWLAVNHGGAGIQVHCLCPQGVRTPMVAGGDARGEAELQAGGRIIEASEVADAVVDAIVANRFLILPHPEVHKYEQAKVDDRDRWLSGMRRLLGRLTP